jgi:hypothetical protein
VRVAPQNRDVLKKVVALLNAGQGERLRGLLEDLDGTSLGPYRSADAAIADAVGRLVAQLDPDEVWLFGSRARGDHGPHSNIDLLVVLPDGLPPESYTLRAGRRPLLGGGAPVDVFPVARHAFDADPSALGGFVGTARSEGRCLYRRLPQERSQAA